MFRAGTHEGYPYEFRTHDPAYKFRISPYERQQAQRALPARQGQIDVGGKSRLTETIAAASKILTGAIRRYLAQAKTIAFARDKTGVNVETVCGTRVCTANGNARTDWEIGGSWSIDGLRQDLKPLTLIALRVAHSNNTALSVTVAR